jgi:hypothetical protein
MWERPITQAAYNHWRLVQHDEDIFSVEDDGNHDATGEFQRFDHASHLDALKGKSFEKILDRQYFYLGRCYLFLFRIKGEVDKNNKNVWRWAMKTAFGKAMGKASFAAQFQNSAIQLQLGPPQANEIDQGDNEGNENEEYVEDGGEPDIVDAENDEHTNALDTPSPPSKAKTNIVVERKPQLATGKTHKPTKNDRSTQAPNGERVHKSIEKPSPPAIRDTSRPSQSNNGRYKNTARSPSPQQVKGQTRPATQTGSGTTVFNRIVKKGLVRAIVLTKNGYELEDRKESELITHLTVERKGPHPSLALTVDSAFITLESSSGGLDLNKIKVLGCVGCYYGKGSTNTHKIVIFKFTDPDLKDELQEKRKAKGIKYNGPVLISYSVFEKAVRKHQATMETVMKFFEATKFAETMRLDGNEPRDSNTRHMTHSTSRETDEMLAEVKSMIDWRLQKQDEQFEDNLERFTAQILRAIAKL